MQSIHGTLTANTVATVNTLGSARDDSEQVEIVNRDGAAEIYFTLDGSTPSVGGANTEVLPAAIGSVVVVVGTQGMPVAKLISSGTPKYTVRVSWPDQ